MEIDEGFDILRPSLKFVNGSCYRILNPCRKADVKVTYAPSDSYCSKKQSIYEDEPNSCSTENKDSNILEWKTQNIASPNCFHKHIVGRNAVVKKRLEKETGVSLHIPRPNENKDYVSVRYNREENLSSVEARIISIVENARKRESPTHFLSIPVSGTEIQTNLEKFRQLCIEKANISEKIIQSSAKLHMTIGALKLFSAAEISAARVALNEFSRQIPHITMNRPLRGRVKGLEIMNDDPSSVRVLYAEMKLSDDSDRLQHLVDQCLEFFVSKNLMNYDYNRQDVKLHCTLINVKWGDLEAIDASQLLNKTWELQDFGGCVLEKLELNEMKTDRKTSKYKNVCDVSLIPDKLPLE